MAGCGGPPAEEQKAVLQPAPPSAVEELEAKVATLENRQYELVRKRAELEDDFSRLKKTEEELARLRSEVLEAQKVAAERAAALREVEAETLEPEKKPEPPPPEPPKVLKPTPGGLSKRPYVVHTSSYKSLELAVKEARRLEEKGLNAYVSEADLGAKGRWWRVLIDRFPTVEEARAFAGKAKERAKLSYAAPMKLPFSVALEAYASPEQLVEAKTALEKKGFHPYVVEQLGPDGSKVYRLRLGAYAKQGEADETAQKASKAGAASAVVTP